MSAAILPASTRLSTVELNARDHRALARFYQDALGLCLHGQDGQVSRLGAGGEDLLRLVQDPAAHEAGRHAKLYHYCLAVERREDLGWWLRRLLDGGFELHGLVDHRMAEAIYLEDPEGNGIELNWDRPRSEWRPWSEWLAMGNAPLDVPGLLAANDAAGKRPELAADARVGHLHLHVGDLAASLAYYQALGLEKTAEVPGQAIFTSAGGYHHHVAFNVWAGRGIAPQPQGAFGLRRASFAVPAAALDEAEARLKAAGYAAERSAEGLSTQDPSGHHLLLKAG
jgi:catechol 2,3-dioxygenase